MSIKVYRIYSIQSKKYIGAFYDKMSVCKRFITEEIDKNKYRKIGPKSYKEYVIIEYDVTASDRVFQYDKSQKKTIELDDLGKAIYL